MKKLLLTITVIALSFAVTQPVLAKTTETTEKVGTVYAVLGIPTTVAFLVKNSAFIGSPEITMAAITAIGAYKTHIGDWGKDGTYAVKNCVGTHVNDNCSHLALSELGTGQATMNGGLVGHN